MAVAIILAALAVSVGAFVLRQYRRRPQVDGEAAERAVRAEIERAGAQDRATRMHPDAVRSWMRPR